VTITFLSREEVLLIHADMILRYGGTSGLRDEGLLSSALAMPEAGFDKQYLHPDIPAMAAAYVFHLVNDHPFVDGNKRVGAMTAYVFLEINGHDLTAAEEAFELLVMGVANGVMTKDAVVEFFRCHTRRR